MVHPYGHTYTLPLGAMDCYRGCPPLPLVIPISRLDGSPHTLLHIDIWTDDSPVWVLTHQRPFSVVVHVLQAEGALEGGRGLESSHPPPGNQGIPVQDQEKESEPYAITVFGVKRVCPWTVGFSWPSLFFLAVHSDRVQQQGFSAIAAPTWAH